MKIASSHSNRQPDKQHNNLLLNDIQPNTTGKKNMAQFMLSNTSGKGNNNQRRVDDLSIRGGGKIILTTRKKYSSRQIKMKNKLLLLLLVVLLSPSLSIAETMRTLEVEFAFTAPAELADQLLGYRLLKNGVQVCETTDATTSLISCDFLTEDGTFDFSLKAYYANSTESPASPIFPFTIGTTTTTSPETPVTPDPLLAVINATPASGEVPLNVAFAATNSTGDIASYAWDFGDGSTGTGSVADHSYAISGTYTATLLVTDQNGASRQVSTTINTQPSTVVLLPPTAVLSSSTAAGEAPLVVNFNGSSSTTTNPPIVSYSWTFGDGSQPATVATTSHSFTTAGTYHTTLTVVDSKGLTSSIDTPIIVTSTVIANKKPTAVISANPPGGVAPVTITFDGSQSSDTDGTITQYNWNFGDGATGSGQQLSHTYTTEGTYTVALTVTDDKGATATATSRIAGNPAVIDFKIEVGEVLIDHNWVQVLFDNSFIEPIVVAGPPSFNDTDPVLVRIRNINPQGFEIRLQEWDYQNGGHAPESFSYIVMEKGTYTLDNGAKVEAGSFAGTRKFSKVNLQQSYDRTPVILSQILTENKVAAATGRIRKIGPISFDYVLQTQEVSRAAHADETVGYIAWEPGTGEISNMLYEAGSTANSVTQNWADLTFQTDFPALPHFIADMQSYDGVDSAAVRSQNMSQTASQIKIEEEQSKDTEVDHTTEVVGYLLLGSKTAAAEKLFTFNWEYGDTQNVSGFRFYLNGNLLCETTNPDDRQISCATTTQGTTNNFSITAIEISGTETSLSNTIQYNP